MIKIKNQKGKTKFKNVERYKRQEHSNILQNVRM